MVKLNSKLLLEAIYPVGSIFINTNGTNPGTFLGGTWEAFGKGRVLVGQDTGDASFDTLGETGGEKTHTLTIQEMPSHNHGFSEALAKWYSGADDMLGGTYDTRTNGYLNATNNTGGGQAHNNLQPYIVVSMWQRTA